MARWAAEAVRDHGGCEVVCPVSLAVRDLPAQPPEGFHGAVGELEVAAAGHPPLLLYDGESVRELGPPGPPLGVDLGARSDTLDRGLRGLRVGVHHHHLQALRPVAVLRRRQQDPHP